MASGIAIANGRVLGTGTDSEVRSLAGKSAKVVDLKGATVIPGLVDGHPHMDMMYRAHPSLAGCTCIDDIQARVAARAKEAKPGQWLIFTQLADPEPRAPRNLKERRLPTKEDLDQVAPDNPVWIRGTYLSPSIVNSAALRMAQITRDTPQPKRGIPAFDSRTGDTNPSPGGRIYKDERGDPTGVLQDYDTLLAKAATGPLWKLMPPLSYERRLLNLRESIADLNSWGITAAHEGHGVDHPEEMLTRAFLDLWSQGTLSVRTHLVSNINTNGSNEEIIQRIDARAYASHKGIGDDVLRFAGIGVTLDGPGGAGDSYHPKSPDYDGPQDEIRDGIQRVSAQKFLLVCREAARRSMRMSTKSGGEPMVELALNTYAAVDKEYGIRDRRWVTFHNQFAHARQLPRMRELGISPVTCITFLWNHGETFRRLYGSELANRSVPMKSFLRAGLPICSGTDSLPKSPFFSMWVMITRTDGETLTTFGEEERLTREEALRVLTNNGAYLLQMEDRMGSLEAGKYADLAVLSDDYMSVPEGDIRYIRSTLTILAGNAVHDPENLLS